MTTEFAKLVMHHLSMRRKLQSAGCQFTGNETTEHLEKMMQTHNLKM